MPSRLVWVSIAHVPGDLPHELAAALAADPAAEAVWSRLHEDDRAGLSAFVRDGWLRRTRRRRARVVAMNCAAGEAALSGWMWMNRAVAQGARWAGGGPPPAG